LQGIEERENAAASYSSGDGCVALRERRSEGARNAPRLLHDGCAFRFAGRLSQSLIYLI
jgi:hypothetical protein